MFNRINKNISDILNKSLWAILKYKLGFKAKKFTRDRSLHADKSSVHMEDKIVLNLNEF